jgi:hypothetical protein
VVVLVGSLALLVFGTTPAVVVLVELGATA